jgi:hypothetical protein
MRAPSRRCCRRCWHVELHAVCNADCSQGVKFGFVRVQVVCIAGVCEFLGAVLLGANVTGTIK